LYNISVVMSAMYGFSTRFACKGLLRLNHQGIIRNPGVDQLSLLSLLNNFKIQTAKQYEVPQPVRCKSPVPPRSSARITFPCPQFSILQQATPKINHENKIFIGSRPPISGLVKHGQELCAVGNSVAVSVAAVLSRAACL
jgi:hypothetical protein